MVPWKQSLGARDYIQNIKIFNFHKWRISYAKRPAVSDASNRLSRSCTFLKDRESSLFTLQRHFNFCDWLLTSWLAPIWELVNFKLKQYFHCSVISGPIIFCLLIACFSGDSLVMSEHLINSSAYYKLRLSVLKSPFWLVTLLAPKWYLQAWGTNSPLVRVVTSCPTRTRANKGLFNSLFRELWRLPARHILEHNESWVQKLVTIGQISLSQPKQQSGQPDLRGHALSQSGLKLITKIRR